MSLNVRNWRIKRFCAHPIHLRRHKLSGMSWIRNIYETNSFTWDTEYLTQNINFLLNTDMIKQKYHSFNTPKPYGNTIHEKILAPISMLIPFEWFSCHLIEIPWIRIPNGMKHSDETNALIKLTTSIIASHSMIFPFNNGPGVLFSSQSKRQWKVC